MENDTPKHRSSGCRFASIVTVAFVFYVLSTGPVWWLHKHGVMSKSVFAVIYQPIGYFIEHSPGDICYRYIAWWSPVIEF
jgi:hypothetical protein